MVFVLTIIDIVCCVIMFDMIIFIFDIDFDNLMEMKPTALDDNIATDGRV